MSTWIAFLRRRIVWPLASALAGVSAAAQERQARPATLTVDEAVQSACVDVVLAQQNLALARSRLVALQFQNDVRQQQARIAVAQNHLKTLIGGVAAGPIEIAGELRRDPQPVDLAAVRLVAETARWTTP